jgi:hypothetical protein
VDNYLVLPTSTSLDFGTTTNFSVSYWIQYPNVPANNDNGTPGDIFPDCDLPVFGNAVNATYQNGFCIAQCGEGCEGNPGAWIWTLFDGITTIAVAGPAHSVDDQQWHNLVYTFDRTGNANSYLDGQLVNVTNISAVGSIDTGNPYVIGSDPTGAYGTGSPGAGNLDDLGVWTRVLTPYEAYSIWYVGKNFGLSFDVTARIKISLVKVAGGYGISWPEGTLQSATSLSGPWTAVAGATAPFYQFTPATTGSLFFRVLQ